MRLTLLSAWLFICSQGYANGFQPAQVSGKVTDKEGMPLVGVGVAVKGSLQATSTDQEGLFTLSLPNPSSAVLVFSYVGYLPVELTVNGRSRVEVVLLQDELALEEVVVVGFGVQKKETVTGSISSVSTKELVRSPVANISNALVGRVPGVTATQSSGEPGDDASTLRIRGMATLNWDGQDPLVVIDGIQSNFGVLNAMDANEIENISVLKDASATAVYGVRGANGVIIVTTRRGRVGKPQFNFTANLGTSHLATKLKMLESYEYALFRNEAIESDRDRAAQSFRFTDEDLWKFYHGRDFTPTEIEDMNISAEQKEALANSPAIYYVSRDFFDEIFGEQAGQQQYNLNISGGTEATKYFASLGYFSQNGVFRNANYGGTDVNSGFKRYNLRSNFDVDVAKNLKLTVGIGGQFADRRGIVGSEQDGPITSAYSRHKAMLVGIFSSSPFVGPGLIDGKLVSGFVGYGNNPIEEKGSWGGSPVTSLLARGIVESYTSNLNADVKAIHTMDYLLDGLSLSGTVSYYDTYVTGKLIHNSIPMYGIMREPTDPAEVLFIGGTVGPTFAEDRFGNYKSRQFYVESALNYANRFGDHAVSGLVLFNAQRHYNPNLLFNVPEGLMGIASRFTYNFKERYLAEFNMGYNGSENFPEDKRFGFFPAVSGGWVISNESFFPENDWVNLVKFRGSYGEVGNDRLAGRRFLYLPSTWGTGDWFGYHFGDSNGGTRDPLYGGAYESTVGNPNVTWERARKTNLAIELGLFKNRLTFTGDYFTENRDNILWSLGTVPGIVAADLPPANIGEVSNRGFELQLGWMDQAGDFRYGVRGSLSYARNRIEFMDEPLFPYDWMNTTGFQLGQFKGWKSAGFYDSDAEAYNRPYSSIDGNRVQAGDIRYVDIDGDGKLDINDNVPVGYGNLPRMAFNGTVNVGYKGFDIVALFIGTDQGSLRIDGGGANYLLHPFYMNNGAAFQFQYDGHWTPEKVANGETPTYPRASLRTSNTINGVASDFWVSSTRFVRLKNVEAGYLFDGAWVKRMGLSGLRVYANGNNLYTWNSTLIDGFDPEQQQTGSSAYGYVYPMMRVFNFGAQIQF